MIEPEYGSNAEFQRYSSMNFASRNIRQKHVEREINSSSGTSATNDDERPPAHTLTHMKIRNGIVDNCMQPGWPPCSLNPSIFSMVAPFVLLSEISDRPTIYAEKLGREDGMTDIAAVRHHDRPYCWPPTLR